MIYLSFDIEEFDMPKEYGYDIDFESQIEISTNGLEEILSLLKQYDCKATFFSTAVFAQNAKPLINRILDEGHELASHTYFHSDFENSHLLKSKQYLEREFNTPIFGLRMPRMAEVCSVEVKKAGYEYNSSVNPTILPGRYNQLKTPKTIFKQNDLWQIPAGVSPVLRIPLFWLSFHHFPQWFFNFLLKRTLKQRGYATLYFHPWEFSEIEGKFNLPWYATKNSGETMVFRFENLLKYIKKHHWKTELYKDLLPKK